MAPRKTKPEPAVVLDAIPTQPSMSSLPNPVTVASSTPRTRDDIALRDAVRARLAAVETVVVDFVADKVAEGFSLDEIDQLYAVELPVLFGYRNNNGRIRAAYDGQIVERAG